MIKSRKSKPKSKKSRRVPKKQARSPKKPKSTTFEIRIVGTARLTLSDVLIASIDDGWRKQFYNLRTLKEIAEHIGFNMLANDLLLSEIDGFADRQDAEAVMVDASWEMIDD